MPNTAIKSKNVALCVITYKRSETLTKTLRKNLEQIGNDISKTYILCNDGETSWRTNLNTAQSIEVLVPEQNLGVAGGRQALADRAIEDGMDILIFIDDDAVFESMAVEGLIELHQEYSAIAFRSTGLDGGTRHNEIPPGVHDPLSAKDVATFIGVGHSIRAADLNHAKYDTTFMYGFEEFYLAFQLIEAGERIRYSPEFTVIHLADPGGRQTSSAVALSRLRNKSIIADRFFLLPFRLTCTLVWATRAFMAGAAFGDIIKASRVRSAEKMKLWKRFNLFFALMKLGHPVWR